MIWNAHSKSALLFCITGSDRKIKEFEEAPGAGTQITKEVDSGVPLTQVGHRLQE